MTVSTETDPWADSSSTPALSFKDAPHGTFYEGVVTESPKLVQSRDYNTGEPAFWPGDAPGTRGKPKMSVVFTIRMDDGEERSVWAAKPSSLYEACKNAKVAEGGRIRITYTHDVPSKNPKNHPAKQYDVKFKPGAPADAWAETPAPNVAAANARLGNMAGGAPAAADDDQPPF